MDLMPRADFWMRHGYCLDAVSVGWCCFVYLPYGARKRLACIHAPPKRSACSKSCYLANFTIRQSNYRSFEGLTPEFDPRICPQNFPEFLTPKFPEFKGCPWKIWEGQRPRCPLRPPKAKSFSFHPKPETVINHLFLPVAFTVGSGGGAGAFLEKMRKVPG